MRPCRPTPVVAVLTCALVQLAVVLSACGESTGDQASQPPPPGTAPAGSDGGSADRDACDLVTREEAAAAAGNAVKPGTKAGVICIFEPEDIDEPANLQVSVAWVPIPPTSDADEICKAGLPGIPNAKPLPDAGIGNSAYWDYTAAALGNAGNLHLCLDNGMLDTSAIGARPEAQLKDIALSLARTALGRL